MKTKHREHSSKRRMLGEGKLGGLGVSTKYSPYTTLSIYKR
jgi:hypothetical protein